MLKYKNETHFSDASKFRKHPILGIWCDTEGNIYSSKTGKVRISYRLRKKHDGYLMLSFKRTSYLAHRLIAQTWISNPDHKPKVNHKNGIKHDNRVENLEWVTQRENIIHARDVLGIKYSVTGFQSSAAKVTEKEERIMMRLWNLGFRMREIAQCLEYAIPTIQKHIERNRMGKSERAEVQPKK